MESYQFNGAYESWCEVDGLVLTVAPGAVESFPVDPGPLWSVAKSKPAPKTLPQEA